LSPSHKEALASIIYGVEKRKGFVKITGEVGVGKTTILRSYLDKADKQRLKIIYVFNANISFKGLLEMIYQEMNLEIKTPDVLGMVNHLQQVLIEEYRKGRNTVLIVDEAQNIPIETLENLRMLSNLETSTDKLIQIVLIGQPEFEKKLNLKELRQLKQRISIRTTITSLTQGESRAYILHRLAKVATNNARIFTKRAINRIIQHAKGSPRILNILCDNALINGYGYQKNPVTSRIAKEVIFDFEGKRKQKPFKWGLATSASVLLLAALLWVQPYEKMIYSRMKNLSLHSLLPFDLTHKETGRFVGQRTSDQLNIYEAGRQGPSQEALENRRDGNRESGKKEENPEGMKEILPEYQDLKKRKQSNFREIVQANLIKPERQKPVEWSKQKRAQKIDYSGDIIKEVRFAEFMNRVESGEVSEVFIQVDGVMTGKSQDGKTFNVPESDPKGP
jgi:type II secretory pathway predicted ATPase ExeA